MKKTLKSGKCFYNEKFFLPQTWPANLAVWQPIGANYGALQASVSPVPGGPIDMFFHYSCLILSLLSCRCQNEMSYHGVGPSVIFPHSMQIPRSFSLSAWTRRNSSGKLLPQSDVGCAAPHIGNLFFFLEPMNNITSHHIKNLLLRLNAEKVRQRSLPFILLCQTLKLKNKRSKK